MSVRTAAERVRSPRYPGYSLPKAVDFAERAYRGVHRSAVDSMTFLKEMGFAGRSGASATALGTVRQYGLIQGYADDTRVSDLALSIFEPLSNSERIKALREAASSPTVFKQVYERFSGKLPNSNEAIRAFLVRELSFSSKAADECVSSLRDTEAYIESFTASESPTAEIPGIPDSGESSLPSITELAVSPPVSNVSLAQEVQTFSDSVSFKLTRDCRVELRFMGPASEVALNALLKYIELMRDSAAE